jgi:signal transduction histidine kinase
VLGDRDRLARVVRNLTDNAVRHAELTVELTLSKSAHHALVEIADDGPGVPAGERERVFDRFVRLEDSRSRAEGGTGLGLAIVRQVVRAHAGTVGFVDATRGARVQLRLPLP